MDKNDQEFLTKSIQKYQKLIDEIKPAIFILQNKKIGKIKNLFLRIITLGCYDFNHKINIKINIKKEKINFFNQKIKSLKTKEQKEPVGQILQMHDSRAEIKKVYAGDIAAINSTVDVQPLNIPIKLIIQ